MTVSATHFSAELNREIFTTFLPPTLIASSGNRDKESTHKGAEIAISANLGAGFTLHGALKFLDAKENRAEEVRRPENLTSAVLDWEEPSGRFGANLLVRYDGKAPDSDFTTGASPAPTTTLDESTLLNFYVRAKLADRVAAYGRVENLLGETHEPVFTFVGPGRAGVFWIEARF